MASTLPNNVVESTKNTGDFLDSVVSTRHLEGTAPAQASSISLNIAVENDDKWTTERGLTERFVNLYQVPEEMELSFQGDIDTSDLRGNFTESQLKPVRPNSPEYMPMVIELLTPKITIDTDAVLAYNQELEQAALDGVSVGDDLANSDDLLETTLDYDLVFQTIEQTPPLVLYINPSDLTRTFQRRIQEQMAGNGHIIEHWGEDQDKLSANGKIGAAYTTKTGLTRYFRRNAASYQQLMHLYIMYRNNGYIFEVMDPRRISLVGRVQITYDTEVWIGHFDTFTMSENADNPFMMDYSFEFTVREYSNDESLR